jgi:hypothetical protein
VKYPVLRRSGLNSVTGGADGVDVAAGFTAGAAPVAPAEGPEICARTRDREKRPAAASPAECRRNMRRFMAAKAIGDRQRINQKESP